MCIKGKYTRGKQSVEEYLMETAIMNPFASLVYINHEGKQFEYPRAIDSLPVEASAIQPHPHGLELGILMRLMKHTDSRNMTGFFTTELSRVGRGNAVDICNRAGINPKTNPRRLSRDDVDKLLKALNTAKIQKPPTDCLSPVGEEAIKKGLKKEMNPEFIAVVSRSPVVYKGHPFQIEVGIGYGGDLKSDGTISIMRFANKVPLIYQQSACAITKSITKIDWKRYGLKQSNGSIPTGPVAIVVHMASVWVPYTSEGKEAIAAYSAIIKEVTLALQVAARKLGLYVSKKRQSKEAEDRLRAFDIYAGELCEALADITGVNTENIHTSLKKVIEEKVGDTSIVLHGKGMEIQDTKGTIENTADKATETADTPTEDRPEDGKENAQARLDVFNSQEK